MNKVQLAIIVINYKTPNLVLDCMESLAPELAGVNAKVIIIDNNSGDDSCILIQNWINSNVVDGSVILLSSETNSGFSAGNNLGIRNVFADYYLLLNSDTLVHKGAIKYLLEYAEKDSSAGLISPRLEWKDAKPQESCFKFHSPLSELISSATTGFITRLLKSFVVAQSVRNKNDYYDWTSFACVLIKSQVFEDVGLLDDGYFMYYEDVNFCYRAKQAGWKILNIPSSHVVHLRGGSSPVKSQAKLRKRLPRYFFESRTRYFYQIYGRVGLLLANVLWMLGWTIALVRLLITPSFQPNISAHQWRDIWTNFWHPLKSFIHPDNYDKT